MKLKSFLLIFSFLFNNLLVFSQEIFEVKNLMIKNRIEGVLTIEKYSNTPLHKNKKCDFKDNTAELKLCQFFNLGTKEELINFFSPYDIPSTYSKEDFLERMKIYDKKNNFYELDSKYTFDYGISRDIFIKYINYNEVFPKPVYSAAYLQNLNNKLVLKGMGENFDIGLLMINANTDKTIDYFNKSVSKKIDFSSFCSKFLDNIKNNKNDLYDLLDKKYSPFFNEKTTNDNELTKNTSQNVFTYNYKKEFHDIISGFVLKKNVISKKEISEKYKIPLETLTKDSLSVKEVISINTLNNDFTIIKFYDSKPIIKTDYEIINNEVLYKNINLLGILTKLNLDFFVELSVNNKNEKFPVASKLQPLIRDADGTLNISKLAEVLEKNKKELAKYLEE
jgi:hypothetical protein